MSPSRHGHSTESIARRLHRRATESATRRKMKDLRRLQQSLEVGSAAKLFAHPPAAARLPAAAPATGRTRSAHSGQHNADPRPSMPSPARVLIAGVLLTVLSAVLTLPALQPRWIAIARAPVGKAIEKQPTALNAASIPTAVQAVTSLPQLQAREESPAAGPSESETAVESGQIRPEERASLASPPVAISPPASPTSLTPAGVDLALREEAAPPNSAALVRAQEADSASELAQSPPSRFSCEVQATDTRSEFPAIHAAQDFGRALAAAALKQTSQFTVYTDKYRTLAYPMGDVPPLYGVCTDVVIRAYRALGIDLQARVHASRVGSSDVSIAHRRTFTLRRYFASRGASLPVTDFAEDYRPGDVVTYFRPQNTSSRDHIAIVADALGPSGRPMIIHNRGWGPQIEDALFVDKITGHYRYSAAQDRLFTIAGIKTPARIASAGEIKTRQEFASSKRAKAARAVLKARTEARRTIKE